MSDPAVWSACASVNPVAVEFDNKAAAYEVDRLSSWYKAQGRLALELLDLRRDFGGTVLDVGCGSGWLLRRLARRHAAARGIGVDLSPRMVETAVERARREALDRLSFLQADWEDPRLSAWISRRAPGGVEVLLCISAFHYFRNPAEALRRMQATLAPGGRLLIVERAKSASWLTFLWDKLHRHWLRDQVRFYRQEEILSMMSEVGLARSHVEATVRRYLWHGKLYTSLAVFRAARPGG